MTTQSMTTETATTTTTTIYYVNIVDSEDTPGWAVQGRDVITGVRNQDSGRCWLTVETTDPVALEAALDSDDDVLEYEAWGTAIEEIHAAIKQSEESGECVALEWSPERQRALLDEQYSDYNDSVRGIEAWRNSKGPNGMQWRVHLDRA